MRPTADVRWREFDALLRCLPGQNVRRASSSEPLKPEASEQPEAPSSDGPGVALYIVLSGAKHRVDDVRRRVLALGDVSSNGSQPVLRDGNNEVPVCGLDGGEQRLDRIWFRVDGPNEKFAKPISTIAHALGWKATVRWGRNYGNHVLPPDPGALLKKKVQTGFPHPAQFVFPTIDAVYRLMVLWDLLGASRTTPGDSVIVAACVLVVVGLWAHYLYSYFCCGRLRTLDAIGLNVCGLIWAWAISPAFFVILLAFYVVTLPVGWLWYARATKQQVSSPDIAIELTQHELTKVKIAGMTPRDRINKGKCLVCDYDLRGLESCRCPECGTKNYYLFERRDARGLARVHGMVTLRETPDTGRIKEQV